MKSKMQFALPQYYIYKIKKLFSERFHYESFNIVEVCLEELCVEKLSDTQTVNYLVTIFSHNGSRFYNH